MNIHPGTTKSSPRRTSGASGSSVGAKLATVLKVAFVIAAVAGLFNSYIYLNQKINETERAFARNQRELHQVNREIDALRIHREQLSSWQHIGPMIQRFGLKLHQARPGQIVQIAILTPEQAAMIPLNTAVGVRRGPEDTRMVRR